jgi:hypothetical protein
VVHFSTYVKSIELGVQGKLESQFLIAILVVGEDRTFEKRCIVAHLLDEIHLLGLG